LSAPPATRMRKPSRLGLTFAESKEVIGGYAIMQAD
jgi:hypothetical protein